MLAAPVRRLGTAPVRLRATSANRRRLLLLTALFVCSRVVVRAVGVPFDLSTFEGPARAQQLLPAHLLRADLVTSVWHLHSQPPLWNLAAGLLLRLPASWLADVATIAYAGFGLLLVLSTYQAMVDLHVPPWVAWVAAALVAISPATILYENWLFYAYPTAALLAFMVLCGIRYLRTQRWPWGFACFLSLAVVVLLNSTYQIEWLLAVVLVVGVAQRRRWRNVLAAAALPVALAGAWYVKDAVQFGTFTTSSWLGMNLTKTTLVAAPPGVVAGLVDRGKLTPLAEVGPFSPVGSYVPRFVKPSHTGIAALDETGRVGSVNLNNLAYVDVSRLYLSDDLRFIQAEPGRYVATVTKAGALWFAPTDEFFHNQPLGAWSRVYDTTVLLNPVRDRQGPYIAVVGRRGPTWAQVSYTSLAGFAIVVLGAPALAWRARRRDTPMASTLAVLWVTVVYALVATSLIEFGENQRFHFESGPLAVIAALAVLAAAWRGRGLVLARRGRWAPRP